ncbi:carnitine dehydratase [Acuticoccus sediminis]|uniref:Carnitine dehydratase n=1 Tax=Acuticoccus sediminis TaxID=2184697 RepID=A0A8B2NG86_9HYPH|nr:CoA transferase [Acuticoccus sediminis]RAH96784.1 carnitine dehydratase [Acuticoccus sediminis]
MTSNALEGVVVLDFGQLIAAPVCGMWLADLGATVIKIEPPSGELARTLGPPSVNGESVVLLASNRNKLGLSLDLKHRDARRVVARAAQRADVLVHNFRPGVAERLGMGFADLRAVQPRLVYCAISAYGQTGPWRDQPGVDGIVQAASGIMNTIGSERGPGKVPLPVADMTGALFATISILAALRTRDRTGHGASLDIDLFAGMMMLQHLNLTDYLTNGALPQPTGSAASYAAPNEAFPTADGWIMVAAYQGAKWPVLCEVLGCPDLAGDPRFATNGDRVTNRAELHRELDRRFAAATAREWAARLAARDVMATPVADFAAVVESGAYQPQRSEVTTDHPASGPVRMPRFAFGSTADPGPQRAAPMLGQDSRAALELVGFAPREIEALIADGVVSEGAAA